MGEPSAHPLRRGMPDPVARNMFDGRWTIRTFQTIEHQCYDVALNPRCPGRRALGECGESIGTDGVGTRAREAVGHAGERASMASDRGMPEHGAMSTVAGLRVGRSNVTTVVAATSVFVPITLFAWASWQAIEGDRNTLLRPQFSLWAWVTFGAAVLTCVAAGVFWRSRKARIGVALGAMLAGLAMAGGLVVDIVGSGGLA